MRVVFDYWTMLTKNNDKFQILNIYKCYERQIQG